MAASVTQAARATLSATRSNRSSVRHFRSLMARRHVRNVANRHRAAMPAVSETRNYAASLADCSDEEVVEMLLTGQCKPHNLEKDLEDAKRAVTVRRDYLRAQADARGHVDSDRAPFDDLPQGDFDYSRFYSSIEGANCESVIGFVPLPVGVVGPLNVNGKDFVVPMATTEGALIASTNRGANAISKAGGAHAAILKNGMTRAPLIRMESAAEAAKLKSWVDTAENKDALTKAFNSTTRFGKLQSVDAWVVGRNVYLRFACHCGDAMGMNMVTKGCVEAIAKLQETFPAAKLISMSGNACSDKKAAAINWVQGRGRSVVCEATIPKDVVNKVLKTTADDMIFVNINKNLIGSAVAGSLGGYNAHAANIVAAVFLATGNDPAQVVESSQCITVLEKEDNGDLYVSVTMPSIEVGTVGGGTSLPAQAAALAMMGCQGANREATGANADTLAQVVAGSVMAGELSLIAALATNDLLKAHIELNRKPVASAETTASTSTQARTYHSDARQLHTSSQYASSIGHPSAGGPKQQSFIADSLEEELPVLYHMPGMMLQQEMQPPRVHMTQMSEEDLYGEGPMLCVP
eukprot:TRINITY_DN9492_c1_g2_i1.p1 TRINITY_DN9492_c1_g2~~TRINITY_DN9492_c1_g2_i1.p1  ORF type:complete len:622 (+),score=201.21 TRINITY_DN9492_c1_g2_i1:131-1867(+)